MRHKYYTTIALMLLVLALSACTTAMAQGTTPTPRSIQVTGSGQVMVTPDMANISIGVHTEGEDAARAVESNNARAREVIDVLKSLGVDEKDIQTTNFNIYPRQDYDDRGRVLGTTYVVENTVYVTIRDLSTLGGVLNAVVGSGANSIYGIQFDAADKAGILSEARQAAVAEARAQAEELARAAGVTLGEVQSISTASSYPRPVFDTRAEFAQVAAEVPISPGQLSLSVEVTVVYEIQ